MASLIMGIRIRLTMNPGASRANTGALPNLLLSAEGYLWALLVCNRG